MSSLVPPKYPLDLTGNAISNKVTDEPHTLPNLNYRIFAPKYGAFFSEAPSVRDAATNRSLVKGVDYFPAMLHTMATEQTGLEVHQIIVITDKTCGPDILFDGQMLGGEYSYNYDAIVQLIQRLDLDNRPVLFEAIIGKPTAWNPTPHLHDIGDVYGFEYMVGSLERIREAILLGAAPSTKAIYDYVNNKLTELKNFVQLIKDGQSTPESIISALGYVPISSSGGEFTGPVTFSKGLRVKGPYVERIKRINATSTNTPIDVSEASVFVVTLQSSTRLSFDFTKMTDITGDDSLSFVVVLKNDAAGNHAVAFDTNIDWADGALPPRNNGANSKDEYYFSTFDGGVTLTGSLSNENTGPALG